METLGLIGVGLLGGALAERFLRGGYAVVGFDPREERRRALAELGGRAATSAREVVAGCRRVILCLPDSNVVTSVLHEAEPQLGQTILDTTTGDPERTRATGEELAIKGIAYVDACILGSSDHVRGGEAVVMAGGERIEDNVDLLRCFARQWFHVGPWGNGARMKLVVNLVLGLNRAVLAEGLAFARGCGLDPAAALEVLRAGVAYSRVMDTKGDKMLARDFTPQARVAQHLKDVRLILEQGQRVGSRMPLSEVHRALLERVVELGGGDDDNAAVIRAYD